MVYRKYLRRRRPRRYRRYRKRGALALAKSNRKFIKQFREKHVHTADVDEAVTTNFVQVLSAIATGDNYYNRTGNKILLDKMYITGSIRCNDDDTFATVYCCIIQDLSQRPATAPTFTEVFDGSALTGIHLKPTRLGRYRVLWSKWCTVYAGTKVTNFNGTTESIRWAASGPMRILYEKTIKPARKILRYTSSSSTDNLSNGIYFLSTTSNATNAPQVKCKVSMYFWDS